MGTAEYSDQERLKLYNLGINRFSQLAYFDNLNEYAAPKAAEAIELQYQEYLYSSEKIIRLAQ